MNESTRLLINALEKNREESPRENLPASFIRKMRRNLSTDVHISQEELFNMQFCERCGGKINYTRLLTGSVTNSCLCDFCGGTIFRDFVLYFPEVDEFSYASICSDIQKLVYREYRR